MLFWFTFTKKKQVNFSFLQKFEKILILKPENFVISHTRSVCQEHCFNAINWYGAAVSFDLGTRVEASETLSDWRYDLEPKRLRP